MMSNKPAALPPDAIKSIVLICLADSLVGLSYGSLAISEGFPLWVPLSLSLLVLAGASEFMFIGIVAGGGSPLTAAAAGLLVNLRHFPFGIAVKDLAGRKRLSWLGCHIMNDESVVVGISQENLVQRRAAYWACGLGIAFCWPVSVLAGAFYPGYPGHGARRRVPGDFNCADIPGLAEATCGDPGVGRRGGGPDHGAFSAFGDAGSLCYGGHAGLAGG